MKPLLVLIVSVVLSFQALAEVALNKTTASQYFEAIKKLQLFEQKNPELAKRLNNSDFLNKDKFMSMIKSYPQFSEIEEQVKQAGLPNFDAFYELGMRVTGGMMAVQMEQMPKGMDIEQLFSSQQQTIEKMKAANVPQEQIDEMSKSLQDQRSNMEQMLKLAKRASDTDIDFVRKNISWLMQNMQTQANQG